MCTCLILLSNSLLVILQDMRHLAYHCYGRMITGCRLIRPLQECTKCGETKPHTEFNRDKTKADGLQFRCKGCVHEYMRRRRRSEAGQKRKRSDAANHALAANNLAVLAQAWPPSALLATPPPPPPPTCPGLSCRAVCVVLCRAGAARPKQPCTCFWSSSGAGPARRACNMRAFIAPMLDCSTDEMRTRAPQWARRDAAL